MFRASLSLATIVTPALLALSLVGCGGDPVAPLRIGTLVWPGYEPLYLARERGYLDPKSVRLVEYPSNSEVTRAFRNRAIEAAALTFDEVHPLLASSGRRLMQGMLDQRLLKAVSDVEVIIAPVEDLSS